MALDSLVLRTTPQYWIAAVYKRVPGKGLVFQGYTPYARVSWPKWLDRLTQLGDVLTRSYYWDGSRWVLDPGGDELTGGRARVSGDKLERRSPLPVGRYWQDVFAKQGPDFRDWLEAHLTDGSVSIEKIEAFQADPLRDGSWLPAALQPDFKGTIPDRSWVLFNVLRPVDWPATKLGFPTIANPSVQTSTDTADNPPGPSPTDEVVGALKDATGAITLALGLFLGIKVVQALKK